MPAGYVVNTSAALALSAATAKSVVAVVNGANSLIRIVELSVSFDGVTASAVPVLCELCSSTQAAAGTSTSHTILQVRGPTRTAQATAERNYTVEPTVLTVLREWLVPAFMGSMTIQFPLGREPEQTTTGDALILRLTAPATVNARAYMEWEEG